VAPWAAPAGTSAVGPPSPARRSKSGESGEWVTEPARRERPTATGPVRLARCPFMDSSDRARGGSAMLSDADHRAVTAFLYEEARLADEARYAEWLRLWTDDGVYWVPATTDPGADPDRHLSHIYDNRARLETRVKLLQTGVRHSQEPASLMRRLISNIEVTPAGDGELAVESNFILAELAVQARHELHWWAGRTKHRLRRVDRELRMSRKTVVLVNAAEPLPNLAFLI